jgi:hypothetical protein
MADYSIAQYGNFNSMQRSFVEGEYLEWDDIPEHVISADGGTFAFRDHVFEAIKRHEKGYRAEGYETERHLDWDAAHAHLWVRHKNKNTVTSHQADVLKVKANATRVDAGWGGGS